jgi:hypothetical protein
MAVLLAVVCLGEVDRWVGGGGDEGAGGGGGGVFLGVSSGAEYARLAAAGAARCFVLAGSRGSATPSRLRPRIAWPGARQSHALLTGDDP